MKGKLRDVLTEKGHQSFMPIEEVRTKKLKVLSQNKAGVMLESQVTMIGAVYQNILFLFQADIETCKLFFVFKFTEKCKIQHLTMKKETLTRKLLILVVLSH